MILVLDASAFIKLYVVEPGSGVIRRAIRQAAAVLARDATYVEVRATLSRAIADGLLRETAGVRARAEFERDWEGVHVVVPDASLLRRAAECAEAYRASANAALDVAVAEAVARQLPRSSAFRFCTSDAVRADLASRLDLPLLLQEATAA